MGILEKIHSPEDVRVLTEKELTSLADEIRKKITETTAKNGGHLASNLGMVDSEIALHRVFSSPADSIVFDVGHQAYAHKLLTGRTDVFSSLRQSGGMSGFTNRSESKYDTATSGHSGTALSSAIGIAEANRMAGTESYTVAVIGDGSFTNGMVYEALNQLDKSDLRLIVLLNDNAMSISKNVGGMSAYFSAIRTSERYFSFKMRLKKIFSAIPFIGKNLVVAASSVRDFLKRTVGAETWFESLGIDYIGPVNGNDIHKMISVLEEAKSKNHPVVVHMTTKKGAGYAPAEQCPECFHSTAPFDIDTGEPLKNKSRTFTDEFSDMICETAEKNSGIVAITAAMTDGCGLTEFGKRFRNRFFDVGIAEEHAVTFASGLALGGHDHGVVPIVVMYSTFSQRVFDQLWHDFCLQNKEKNDLSMVLMLSHAGLVPGDGVTHQGIYDTALLSRLPDVTIYSPDTFGEMHRAFEKAISSHGLTIIRYPKSGENRYDASFTDHGEWKECTFDEGGDGYDLVVTYGRIAANAVDASREYARTFGRRTIVAVLERITPLPEDDTFLSLVDNARKVFFVEEGIRSGGRGEALAARRKTKIIAIDEPYVRCGSLDDITRFSGLDLDGILRRMTE